MGINLASKTLDLSQSPTTKIIPPFSAGLEYLNLFGGSSEIHPRNLAINRSNVNVIGAPIAGSDFVEFASQQNFVESGVEHKSGGNTFVVVAKPKTDNADTAMISSAGSLRQGGGGIFPGVSLFFRHRIAGDSITQPTFSVGIDPAAGIGSNKEVTTGNENFTTLPACYIAVHDTDAQTIALHNMTYGTSEVLDISDATPLLGGDFRVGSSYNTAFGGTCQAYAAAIYSGAANAGERSAVYDWLKRLMFDIYGLSV